MHFFVEVIRQYLVFLGSLYSMGYTLVILTVPPTTLPYAAIVAPKIDVGSKIGVYP